MSFDLFTIDIIPEDYSYFLGFITLKNWSQENSIRSLFSFTIYHKFIYIDLFFFHLLGEI